MLDIIMNLPGWLIALVGSSFSVLLLLPIGIKIALWLNTPQSIANWIDKKIDKLESNNPKEGKETRDFLILLADKIKQKLQMDD